MPPPLPVPVPLLLRAPHLGFPNRPLATPSPPPLAPRGRRRADTGAQAYKEYRDDIINRFRRNPSKKLTFTECRKSLTGDINTLYRVWNFLNQWGLINHGLGGGPAGAPAASASAAPGAPAAKHMRIEKPSIGDKANRLFRFNNAKPSMSLAGGPNTIFGSLEGRGVRGQVATKVAGGPQKFTCNATGADCTRVRWHCTKVPDFDLAEDVDPRQVELPPGVTPEDFIRIDASVPGATGGGEEWGAQEDLLLLEALELHGDNWGEVAEHVGTRSQLQCVLRTLQFPVDATMQNGLDTVPGGGRKEEAATVPVIADTGNPIMAQVAFLAAAVGPKVAAAAAKKALEVLAEQNPALAAPPKAGAGAAAAPGGPPEATAVTAASAAALAAAAVKAKVLAEKEEKELQQLMAEVVHIQVQKVQLKLNSLAELEAEMKKQADHLEREQQALFAEQLKTQAVRIGVTPGVGITSRK